MAQSAMTGAETPATNLTSTTINSVDGSASGGAFSHILIWDLAAACRALNSNRQPQGMNNGSMSMDGVSLSVNAQAVRQYVVEPAPPVGITTGPLAGVTAFQGIRLKIVAAATAQAPGALVADYLIPYSELELLNTAAIKCVKLYP